MLSSWSPSSMWWWPSWGLVARGSRLIIRTGKLQKLSLSLFLCWVLRTSSLFLVRKYTTKVFFPVSYFSWPFSSFQAPQTPPLCHIPCLSISELSSCPPRASPSPSHTASSTLRWKAYFGTTGGDGGTKGKSCDKCKDNWWRNISYIAGMLNTATPGDTQPVTPFP